MSIRAATNEEFEGLYNPLVDQLTQFETTLLRGNRGILFRHARWHYVTLGNLDGGLVIDALNFMSPARAESLLTNWLAKGERPAADAHVSPIWAAEVAEKILPTATDYRSLLLTGRVRLVRGSTTDTLWVADNLPDDEDRILSYLAQMMERGQAGPYLRFSVR
jgi:hypothetical protein